MQEVDLLELSPTTLSLPVSEPRPKSPVNRVGLFVVGAILLLLIGAGAAVVDGNEDFDPAVCAAAVNELGYKAEVT